MARRRLELPGARPPVADGGQESASAHSGPSNAPEDPFTPVALRNDRRVLTGAIGPKLTSATTFSKVELRSRGT